MDRVLIVVSDAGFAIFIIGMCTYEVYRRFLSAKWGKEQLQGFLTVLLCFCVCPPLGLWLWKVSASVELGFFLN
jgi:hypothetical protein